MKIIHYFGLDVDEEIKRKFMELNIQLELGISCFEIDESSPNWPEVKKLADLVKITDFVSTSFSEKELRGAENLRLVGDWHHGYPEPSDDFGYLSEVYNLDNYCNECGSGLVQKDSFKFLRDPKWGSRHIMQLNWVYDEFFVKPEIWERVFKPFGIECREVLHRKSCRPLETVVQLVIPEEDVTLSLNSDYPSRKCNFCSSIKYLPISRGFFPSLSAKVKAPIFKTHEFFGSGASAHKAVIISQELYVSFFQNQLKRVAFYPLLNAFK